MVSASVHKLSLSVLSPSVHKVTLNLQSMSMSVHIVFLIFLKAPLSFYRMSLRVSMCNLVFIGYC